MSGASANSCVIRSPRLCGFHQRDEGDQRSNLSPCLLSASDPEFASARGFYVWSPDSGVLPHLRAAPAMKYSFIAAHQEEFPINRLCQVLNVSESGYYAWRKREPSQRQREDERLGKLIEDAYHDNRQVYGSPRVPAEFEEQGVQCGSKRVGRSMRGRGI